VGVCVGVDVDVMVTLGVIVGDCVGVGVDAAVPLGVTVGVIVGVDVTVGDCVGVGDAQISCATVGAGAVPLVPTVQPVDGGMLLVLLF